MINLLWPAGILLSILTDVTEVKALTHKNDIIDIYSNSWGPADLGFVVAGPDTLAKKAFEMGAKKVISYHYNYTLIIIVIIIAWQGRGGKGSIYVWAAGNGGDQDSCAADGYVNSIYTIAIGSVDIDSRPAVYDERCSAKIVVTFVHNSHNGNFSVVSCTIKEQEFYYNYSIVHLALS